MWVWQYLISYVSTCIDLSKIWGGNENIGGKGVAVTDETLGGSQLLGARAQPATQVYAYVCELCCKVCQGESVVSCYPHIL